MAVTLTYDGTLARVRIAASALGDMAPVRVERSTDQVRWTTVRGGAELTPLAGAVQLDDYEFAPDVPNYYRVVGPTAWDAFSRLVPPPLNANPYFETDGVVVEGGFEVNMTGWAAVNGSAVRSTAQAHAGAASALVTPSGAGVVARVEADMSLAAPAVPGQTFTAEAWVRPTTASKPAAVQITWRDSGGVFLSSTVQTAAATAGAWQFLSVTGVAPAGAAFAQPAAGVGSTPTAVDTAHVDELRLLTVPNWMAAGGTITRSTAQAHEGVASLLLTPDGVTASAVARSEMVTVTAGVTYRASEWVRCAVARSVSVGINWYTSASVFISTSSAATSVAANTWTLLDFTAAAPPTAAKGQVTAFMTGTPASSNLLHVDEAMLQTGGGWGTDDSGKLYTTGGGTATDYTVSGGVGRISLAALNSSRRLTLPGTFGTFRRRVKFTVSQVGVGDDIETTMMGRYQDASNYMQGSMFWDGDSTFAELRIIARVAGVATSLLLSNGNAMGGTAFTLPFTQVGAGLAAWMEFEGDGSTFRLKVWAANAPEPDDWTTTATDTTWASGLVGFRANLQPGFTGTLPVTVTADNHAMTTPEAVLSTASLTPTIGGVWLKSVARPFLNRRVIVQDYSDVERPARGGAFDVIGRSYPVAVSDVRGSRRWNLVVLTETPTEAGDVDLLLASGDPLFVHAPADCDVPAGYVTVGDTSQRRTARRSVRRLFELPCVEVAAPGPDVVGATSNWQTVLNTYATWADLLATNPTWDDLLELIGDPTDVVVP